MSMQEMEHQLHTKYKLALRSMQVQVYRAPQDLEAKLRLWRSAREEDGQTHLLDFIRLQSESAWGDGHPDIFQNMVYLNFLR